MFPRKLLFEQLKPIGSITVIIGEKNIHDKSPLYIGKALSLYNKSEKKAKGEIIGPAQN
jgi:hypothetical protein